MATIYKLQNALSDAKEIEEKCFGAYDQYRNVNWNEPNISQSEKSKRLDSMLKLWQAYKAAEYRVRVLTKRLHYALAAAELLANEEARVDEVMVERLQTQPADAVGKLGQVVGVCIERHGDFDRLAEMEGLKPGPVG